MLARGITLVEDRASHDPSPRSLHDQGLIHLTEGRYSTAILFLEAAVSEWPGDPKPLSDLAAACLARSRAENRAFDLVLALDAADRALALDSRLPEALFNRAEALTGLHLRSQAKAAWESYLDDVDRRSARAVEAVRHLKELAAPTVAESWERERPRLQTAAQGKDARTVREIVARFPHLARMDAEERILPAWGAAHRAGDREAAAAWLGRATMIGAALTEMTGDAMIQDTAAGIARAGGPVPALLAEGLEAFGRGMELYNVQNIAEARPRLAAGARALGRAGSPFRAWAEFYGAICDHYSDPERASSTFFRLDRQSDELRYPVLAGRAAWMLGTLASNRGEPEEALRLYQRAFALLDASAGPHFSAFVRVLLAEAYTGLGEIEEAWKQRVAAFATVSRTIEPRRIHAALNEAASTLVYQGYGWPALEMSEELLDKARAWGVPTALAEASLMRGWTLDLLGRPDEAMEELEAAERHAAELGSGGLRNRITGPLALARAAVLTGRDPERAAQILTEALSTDLDNGYQFQLTRMLTARARAFMGMGDPLQAEADLRLAIEQFERIRVEVRNEQLRLTAFERAQEVFDEMIRLQMDQHRSPENAFEYAERSRSRLLRDLIEEGTQALTADELVSRLPEQVTLVQYAVLSDRLLAWVARRGSLEAVEIGIPARNLAKSIEALRNALERRGTVREIRSAAASVYDFLVRPLEANLPPGKQVVFIPDRFLVRAPFAALFDAQRGRHLIEDRPVSVAPSANLYLAALDRSRTLTGTGPRTAFAVGDPAFDRTRYPHLPRLREAGAEAAAVVARYPGSRLLQAEAATRAAFLESAGSYWLIHFAGHALLHPSPRLSRLLLAGGDSSDPGVLYADDLVHHRLDRTGVVVLSACRTVEGSGQRESLTGLAAAFLAAGPPVVVASLWDADDRSTRELMRHFHEALVGGSDPASALRTAQVTLLTGSDPSLRSPAAWAGFEAIGGVIPEAPD